MRPALLFATLLGATIVSSGCYGMFGGVTVDYIDFIRAGDVTYVASYTSGGRELGEVDLGPERLRVKQTLARGGFGPGYQPVDGDAAFVPAGDPVYLVRGYSPNFRLVPGTTAGSCCTRRIRARRPSAARICSISAGK